MVLRKDETAAGQTYKYAKVIKVHTSMDGKVRAADIEYRLPGESAFRTTTRPIHKLVLVVPVKEQTLVGDQTGEEGEEPEQVAPLVERCHSWRTRKKLGPQGRPHQQRSPGLRCKRERSQQEKGEASLRPCLAPFRAGEEATGPAIKLKKVISRKKAGKQARTIIVTMPKEEAEMVDLGARPKKRGRPRKTPNVDPPDPHKGSVLDPKEGVCVDPVDRVAILGRGGPDPHSRDRERQLAPDKGSGKT